MKKIQILIVIVGCVFASAYTALADVPRLIDYQGILTDTGGTPISGTHDLTFGVYADATPGGTPLWTEQHTGVFINDGLFSVTLGMTTPFPEDLFADGERWLGVAVDTDSEITPRARLVSVPWALRAAIADSVVSGGPGTENDPQVGDNSPGYVPRWDGSALTSGSIYDAVNKVGINTATPEAALHVGSGSVLVTGIPGSGNDAPFEVDGGDSTSSRLMSLESGGKTHMVVDNSRIGFRTADPQASLHLGNGSFLISGTAGSGSPARLMVDSGASTAHRLMWLKNDLGTQMVVDDMRVGIGTENPGGTLHVAGSTVTELLVITGGADLAEPFPVRVDADLSPGTVVSIDPDNPGQLKMSTEAYDQKVAGVTSGANDLGPGLVMRNSEPLDGEKSAEVALTGRVWCWCDAAYGQISVGDLLTTSDTPGHAMKVTDRGRSHGAVIGKAMSALPSGRRLVLVLINLQ
jgi:hypothetical protein